ncbi:MAG: 2-phospho-L-lactate guanylyltransferase [Burkholderiaceae bacterium]|nr:2-phospho-L-lactate guanylyltransferase [Microbacteriaceae bacterium]
MPARTDAATGAPTTGTPTTGTWSIVIPVKEFAFAKSRLRDGVLDVAALALAFATDTVMAAVATPGVAEVIVVTGDSSAAGRMSQLGATVVPDPRLGLNAAIAAGIAAARFDAVAVLTGDLPALLPEHLAAALGRGTRHPLALVADHAGIGTTMIASRSVAAAPLRPAFGGTSRAAHEAAGHVVIDGHPGLRRDVDTPLDLAIARSLGVGRATEQTAVAPAASLP